MLYVFALLAGIFTTLSPCVLPLIPIVMGSALQADRLAPLLLVIGFTGSFAVIGMALAALSFTLGIDPKALKYGAATLMGVFGLIMISPVLYSKFLLVVGRVTGRAGDAANAVEVKSRIGHLGLGALLSVVWSPCAGPTLGAAIGMATQGGHLVNAFVIMTIFSVGSAMPMLALSYGSRSVLTGRSVQMRKIANAGKPILGWLLLLVAIYLVSGLDKVTETFVAERMPAWLTDLSTRY